MTFYGPPAPFQLYAYAPMPIANHEIYAVYPSGTGVPAPLDGTQFYYEQTTPKQSYSGKIKILFTGRNIFTWYKSWNIARIDYINQISVESFIEKNIN